MTDESVHPFDAEACRELREGSWRPASEFLAVLPGWAPEPSASALVDSISRSKGILAGLEVAEVDSEQEGGEGALFALEVGGYSVVGIEVECDLDRPGELAGDFSDEDREAVNGAHFGLQISTVLAEPVLEEFHRAIQVLYELAPNAVALFDEAALKWRPASWIVDTASSHAPPSPLSLFSVHGVLSEDDRVWMHTHGLLRCGALEIEVLDLTREGASQIGHVINTTAMMWVEQGIPDPHETFWVGQGLPLAWRPWDALVEEMPGLSLGGHEDREGHDFLVGSLVVPTGKKKGLLKKRPVWASVETLLPAMQESPVFFVSEMETKRMSMLSSSRFPEFRKLVKRFAGEEEWTFAVKLAYQTDLKEEDSDEYAGDEHLWFEVHAIDGAQIDATLMNQPHKIARMKAGDRDWHSADQLSDWTIYSPERSYGPDQLGQLLEQLR